MHWFLFKLWEHELHIEQLNLYITNEKNSLRKPREIIEPE